MYSERELTNISFLAFENKGVYIQVNPGKHPNDISPALENS